MRQVKLSAPPDLPPALQGRFEQVAERTLELPEGDPWRGASARFTAVPLGEDGEPVGNRQFSRLVQPGQAGVNVPAALDIRYRPGRGGGFNRALSTQFEFPASE